MIIEVARFSPAWRRTTTSSTGTRSRGSWAPTSIMTVTPAPTCPGWTTTPHERDDRLGRLPGARGDLTFLQSPRGSCGDQLGVTTAGAGPLGRRQPQDADLLPRRRAHQQFEGYDRLDELDWLDYQERYGDIQRLDRILEAEGDSTNRYKVSKQADVLMVFYLLPPSEVREIPQARLSVRSGHRPRANVEYYLARTSHGSRSRGWCTPGCWPDSTGAARGTCSSKPCAATSPTSRAARRGDPPRRHGRDRRPDPSAATAASRPGRRPAARPCAARRAAHPPVLPTTRPSGRHRHRPRSPRWACCLRSPSMRRVRRRGGRAGRHLLEWSLPPI